MSGDKLDRMVPPPATDSSIITGSLPTTAQISNDPVVQSDELVIRDEIKSLPDVKSFPQELKWDNVVTGSEGIISAIVEKDKNGRLCRRFKATRSAFDGVNLYRGEICQVAPEVWTMTAFDIER